jgi:hypothetical protein
MLACKLAATGLSGVELSLSEVNLSLNELAETPLDNFARPSGIFTLCSLYGSCRRPKSQISSQRGSRSMVGKGPSLRGEAQKRDRSR